MRKTAFLFAFLAAAPLLADLRSDVLASSGWVGWSVPVAEGRHTLCSWDMPASALIVLLRVEAGSVVNVRLSSPECRGPEDVRWIRSVEPRESRRFLRQLADGGPVGKKAVTALALHEESEQELIELARRHHSRDIRGAALFWVGQRAGSRAVETLRDAVDNDPDAAVKAKAVFGIAQLPDDQSVPILIDLMKTHRAREVRKKAAFWLSQKDDPRALAAFEEILRK